MDALGNVRAWTDENGNVVERHDYLSFGEECTTGPCAANPGMGAGQPCQDRMAAQQPWTIDVYETEKGETPAWAFIQAIEAATRPRRSLW